MRTLVIAIIAALGLAACQATPPPVRTNPAADEFPGGFEADPGLPPDRPM